MITEIDGFIHPDDKEVILRIQGSTIFIMDENGAVKETATKMSKEEIQIWADIRNIKIVDEEMFENERMCRQFKVIDKKKPWMQMI